jgi:phosphoglycerate kinase
MEGIKTIKEVTDWKGKRVLLRLGLNVPLINDCVKDCVENDFRIKKSIPTVEYLRDQGAKIIIISHVWGDEVLTLKPVFEYLKKFIKVDFVGDALSPETKDAIAKMQNGDIVLLENLRIHEEEMENDLNFTNRLAQLGDIYVNDAFSVSHRKHSSIIGLPKLLPSYVGLLFEEEVKNLSVVLNPPKPFLFILGGAKFETKMPLIMKYLDRADYVFVGGALANDFFKAKGFNIGKSLVSNEDFGISKVLDKPNLILPKDLTVKNKDGIFVKNPEKVLDDDQILDIGVEAIGELEKIINKSKFILWNGPIGDYEKGFRDGTLDLARAIIKSSAQSVVGGGDTFAVISKLNLEEKFSFMSTAGGAMLEFIYSGTLPGIEALKT